MSIQVRVYGATHMQYPGIRITIMTKSSILSVLVAVFPDGSRRIVEVNFRIPENGQFEWDAEYSGFSESIGIFDRYYHNETDKLILLSDYFLNLPEFEGQDYDLIISRGSSPIYEGADMCLQRAEIKCCDPRIDNFKREANFISENYPELMEALGNFDYHRRQEMVPGVRLRLNREKRAFYMEHMPAAIRLIRDTFRGSDSLFRLQFID